MRILTSKPALRWLAPAAVVAAVATSAVVASSATAESNLPPISAEQLRRLETGLPLTHRLVRLPHLSRRSERLFGPLQGLLVDG